MSAQADSRDNRSTSPKVVLFMAEDPGEDGFWTRRVVETSQLAAEALAIDLEIVFAGTSRPKILQSIEDSITGNKRPNYAILGNQRNIGVDALKILNKHEVFSFLHIAPLLQEDYDRLGGPRASLKYWIGELIPDDEAAGYDLAQNLIAHARKQNPELNRPLKMLAIDGRRSTTSAIQRRHGLLRAVAEHDDVVLVQALSGRWDKDVARQKFELFQKRNGYVDIVWAANDPMAIGVMEAIEPGSGSVSVGGVDWLPPALDALEKNKLVASLGGHHIDIAFVLALLRNHYDGNDFIDVSGTASLESHLLSLSPDTVGVHLDVLERIENGEVDVRAGLSGLDTPDALSNLSIQRFIENSARNRDGRP